jgi:hypothetical protein
MLEKIADTRPHGEMIWTQVLVFLGRGAKFVQACAGVMKEDGRRDTIASGSSQCDGTESGRDYFFLDVTEKGKGLRWCAMPFPGLTVQPIELLQRVCSLRNFDDHPALFSFADGPVHAGVESSEDGSFAAGKIEGVGAECPYCFSVWRKGTAAQFDMLPVSFSSQPTERARQGIGLAILRKERAAEIAEGQADSPPAGKSTGNFHERE